MKTAQTIDEWVQESEENTKAFLREDFILDVTLGLCEHMEKKDINRTHLAKRLGKSKSMVSQLLNGYRNMTLGTLADIAYALNLKVNVHFSDKDAKDAYLLDDDATPALLLKSFQISEDAKVSYNATTLCKQPAPYQSDGVVLDFSCRHERVAA